MVPPIVKLLVLLLAVPAQYFISLWMNPKPEQSPIQVVRVVTGFQNFCKKWFNPINWWTELKKYWLRITDDRGECIAVEIMKYRSVAGHFGNSPSPRTKRPNNVEFRVGKVFLHKSLGYHGVIVGWDDHAKAPDRWLDDHGGRNNAVNSQPYFSVLPDDQESHEKHDYVSQSDIEIVTGRKIKNDFIADYFEEFNGTVYLARPFLRKLYPED